MDSNPMTFEQIESMFKTLVELNPQVRKILLLALDIHLSRSTASGGRSTAANQGDSV